MLAGARLKIHREPVLKNPRLVLSWGCIGQVGIDAVTYLRDKLGAQEFAHIEPYDFFTPAIEVENGLVSGLELPQSRFYSWENSDGDDLILFVGDRELPQGRYEYANLLLEVGQRFRVPRIYTICAFPSPISHTAEPKVFGVVNDAKLVPYLEQYPVTMIQERDLTSINALLLGPSEALDPYPRTRLVPGILRMRPLSRKQTGTAIAETTTNFTMVGIGTRSMRM